MLIKYCSLSEMKQYHPFMLCVNVVDVLLKVLAGALNEVRERWIFPRNLRNWPPSRLHRTHAEHIVVCFFFISTQVIH